MEHQIFVEFVTLSTNIWPKILIFTVTAKCWRERAVMLPPPSHQEVIDVI